MVTFNVKDFINQIVMDKKLLCVDVGKSKLGMATSDIWQKIAFVGSLHNTKDLEDSINIIAREYYCLECCAIIIGLPFTHNRKNNWIEYIINLAENINSRIKTVIYLKDETNSTKNAKLLMKNFSKKRQKKHKDALAACCILQEALDIISTYRETSIHE